MGLGLREKLAIGAALAGVVFFGWAWFSPRWTTKRAGMSMQEREAASAALLSGRFREAVTQDLSAPEAGEALRATLEAKLQDPGRVLPGEQRRLLIETIARHLLTRAESSPEAYLTMADSEAGTRWIDPTSDEEWKRPDDWFKYHDGAAASRDDPRGALSRLILVAYSKEHEKVLRYGAGNRGLVFAVARNRVRSTDLRDDWFLDLLTAEDAEYWFQNPGMAAMHYRVPVRPLERVIEEEGGAVVAACMMAVANEGGVTYRWYTIWYWDAESRSWQCTLMSRRGTPGMMYF